MNKDVPLFLFLGFVALAIVAMVIFVPEPKANCFKYAEVSEAAVIACLNGK